VITALAVMVIVLAPQARRAARAVAALLRRQGGTSGPEDLTLLAELTALGLSAGHTFPVALETAAERVPRVGDEVRAIAREARRHGFALALNRAAAGAPGLYRIAARASLTGAPLLPAVHAHLDDLRGAERLRRLERVRTLPTKMLFPLALLILPGFIVLTVAPALLGALDRLRL